MISFTIDTSVFALPQKTADRDIEFKNLNMLKNNIACLKRLQKKDSVTISYMNNIYWKLKNNAYPYKERDINARIRGFLNANPQYSETLGLDSPVFKNWDDFLFRKTERKDETSVSHKRNLGIYDNIPDRDNEPDPKYISTTFIDKNDIYPKLKEDIKKSFKRYCGYIADLNRKYGASYSNFIVLGGDQVNITVAVKTFNDEVQSTVTIVGIQNLESLCQSELKFKNILSACENAKKKFDHKLDFGRAINKKNLEIKNLVPPLRIYQYLDTLYHISEIIEKQNITFESTTKFSLVEMLNAHGLLCSDEDDKYKENKCRERTFENADGKRMLFTIHLKPSTVTNNREYDTYNLASYGTIRIYVRLGNDKKLLVGWIGKHPPSCSDCIYHECRANPMNPINRNRT